MATQDEVIDDLALALKLLGRSPNLKRVKNAILNAIEFISPEGLPERKLETTTAHALTERQFEVLSLIARDFDNKTIAKHLGISVKTVKNHNSAIFTALKVTGRKEAKKIADKILIESAKSYLI